MASRSVGAGRNREGRLRSEVHPSHGAQYRTRGTRQRGQHGRAGDARGPIGAAADLLFDRAGDLLGRVWRAERGECADRRGRKGPRHGRGIAEPSRAHTDRRLALVMPLIAVQSIDDPRIACYRDLNERNLTRQSGLFIAEGEKVVERLIASHYEVASILAEPKYADKYASLVPSGTPLFVASRELLMATIGFHFHRGVVACGRRKPAIRIADVLSTLTKRVTIVACPDVQDPTNLGSIIRSGAAFGCEAVVLGGKCADPFSRRVLRVSMGAALHLPIVESRDLAADLAYLHGAQFELVA